MLTESEKRWLRGRELSPRPYCASCINAKICAKTRKQCWCPTDARSAHTLSDALDFSERVAVKLARMSVDAMLPCFQTNGDCPYTIPNCAWCRLMVARLLVEEEIDADIK